MPDPPSVVGFPMTAMAHHGFLSTRSGQLDEPLRRARRRTANAPSAPARRAPPATSRPTFWRPAVEPPPVPTPPEGGGVLRGVVVGGVELGVVLGVVVVVVVGLTVGLGVVVGVGVGVGVAVEVGAAHVARVMVSVSRVTAPLRAKTLPTTVTPVVTVMEVNARMFPLKFELVPRVAELPTSQ